jgi:hypothetical protein
MGDKVNPWCHCHWHNPAWKSDTESCAGDLHPPDAGHLTADSVALAPILEFPPPYPSRKRPLVLYQKEKRAPVLPAPLPSKGPPPLDRVPELQGSNETNVTDAGAGEETEEGMHENRDEINAVLDTDRQSGGAALSVESVASAGAGAAPPPAAKKRRLSSCTDKSVVDTASSARPPERSMEQEQEQRVELANDRDAQSCCVGEVESGRRFALGEAEAEAEAAEGDSPDEQRRRRERIQETVAALRNMVPGGIAKDAAAVLDEAICYLQYLKLKVKTLGAVSL